MGGDRHGGAGTPAPPGFRVEPKKPSRAKKGTRRRLRENGPLLTYVKATPRRKGFVDTRLRRRASPWVCETCDRRHWPSQTCWAGPENTKRDLAELGDQAVERRKRRRERRQAEIDAATRDVRLAKQGPVFVGRAQGYGDARLVSGPGAGQPIVRRRS